MANCWRTFYVVVSCVVAAAAGGGSSSSSRLVLLQMFFRHGDRTPLDTFPTDPYIDHWPDGLGQLTNVGKLQLYELGRYARNRYDTFLNDTYFHDEVFVRSTDVDRTLMSAQSHLAGLYPPKGGQVWEPDLDWQPIPVHTVPRPADLLFYADEFCPKYLECYRAAQNLPEVKQFVDDNRDLFELVTKETGRDVHDVRIASKIYDILFVEKTYNLSLPNWVDADVFERLKAVQLFDLLLDTYTTELKRLYGGVLLKELLRNVQDKISGQIDTRQLFIYSTHDSNIAALLSALNVFDHVLPPYACAVFVELHTSGSGSYSLQFFYHNSTTEVATELTVPNCTSPCPLERFLMLTEAVVPVGDMVDECRVVQKNQFGDVAMVTSVVSSVFLLILLLLVVLAVFWKRRTSAAFNGYILVEADNKAAF